MDSILKLTLTKINLFFMKCHKIIAIYELEHKLFTKPESF